MATVNAYTKTQNTTYQPRSLQELMLVPAYKRKQHDELEEAISEYETALSKSDFLDIHKDALAAEQKSLYDRMSTQRDTLSSEGFSPSAKSDFIRFNKEYQKAVGPQGKIGKISAAKTAYETRRAEILNNAIKMRHSPEETQKRLDEQYQNYSQAYDETGEIVNFVGELPPAHEDLYKDIASQKGLLGHTITTNGKKEGYDIIKDESGMLVVKTHSGQILRKTNNANLNSAIENLNSKWLDPNGSGYKSAEWNGMDAGQIADTIKSGIETMRINETKDTRQDNYRFNSPPSPKKTEGQQMDKVSKVLGDSTNSYGPEAVSYDDVLRNIEVAQNAGNQAEANRLSKLLKETKDKFDTTPEASAYYDALENSSMDADIEAFLAENPTFKFGFTTSPEGVQTVENKLDRKTLLDAIVEKNGYRLSDFNPGFGVDNTWTLIKEGEYPLAGGIPKEMVSKYREIAAAKKQYDIALDKTIANKQIKNVGFTFKNINDTDRATMKNDLNQNVLQDAQNLFTVSHSSIIFEKGESKVNIEKGNSESKDSKILLGKIALAANSNLVNLNKFVPENENGLPQLEIRFKDNEGNLHIVALEMGQDNIDGSTLGDTGQTLIDMFKKYGGAEGASVSHYANQVREFRDVQPTVHIDDAFKSTKEIEGHISRGSYINQTLSSIGATALDIGMINKIDGNGYDYVLNVQGGDGSSDSLGWGHFLHTVASNNTKGYIQSLATMSPSSTTKLVSHVKRISGVERINDMSETDIDNAIKYLAENNVSLSFSNHYELMSFISNPQ